MCLLFNTVEVMGSVKLFSGWPTLVLSLKWHVIFVADRPANSYIIMPLQFRVFFESLFATIKTVLDI